MLDTVTDWLLGAGGAAGIVAALRFLGAALHLPFAVEVVYASAEPRNKALIQLKVTNQSQLAWSAWSPVLRVYAESGGSRKPLKAFVLQSALEPKGEVLLSLYVDLDKLAGALQVEIEYRTWLRRMFFVKKVQKAHQVVTVDASAL